MLPSFVQRNCPFISCDAPSPISRFISDSWLELVRGNSGAYVSILKCLASEYVTRVLPNDFQHVIYAIQICSEAHALFCGTIDYFCNILLLLDMLQETQTGDARAGNSSSFSPESLSQVLSGLKADKFRKLLEDKFSYTQSENSVTLRFANLCSQMKVGSSLCPFDAFVTPELHVKLPEVRLDFSGQKQCFLTHESVWDNYQMVSKCEKLLKSVQQKPPAKESEVLAVVCSTLQQSSNRASVFVEEPLELSILFTQPLGISFGPGLRAFVHPAWLSTCLLKLPCQFLLPTSLVGFRLHGVPWFQACFARGSLAVPRNNTRISLQFYEALTAAKDAFLLEPIRRCVLPSLNLTYLLQGPEGNIFWPAVQISDIENSVRLIQSTFRLDFAIQERIITVAAQLALGDIGASYQQVQKLTWAVDKRLPHTSAQAAHIVALLYERHNALSESLLSAYSMLKTGFLSLRHPTLRQLVEDKLNFYETFHLDLQTTWETVYAVLSQVPNATLDEFQRSLACHIPGVESFMVCNGVHDLGISEPTAQNAPHVLRALIHEHIHLQKRVQLAWMEDTNLLLQLLVEMTTLDPLRANLACRFHGQPGVDAGGIWRWVASQVFDCLVLEEQVDTQKLEEYQKKSRFGKRQPLDFQKLASLNPGPSQILKIVRLPSGMTAVPHFYGFVPQTSQSVFPRLTENRSALYYFGRLTALFMLQNTKIPVVLHDNFFKALVGGQYFITPALEKQFAKQLVQNPAALRNGTLQITALEFRLTEKEAESLYGPELQLWKLAQQPVADLDFLCISDQTRKELARQRIDIAQPKKLAEHARRVPAMVLSGAAFAKPLAEFRHGFRHTFADVSGEVYLQDLALKMDQCLGLMSWVSLKALLCFGEERLDSPEVQEEAVKVLLAQNRQRIDALEDVQLRQSQAAALSLFLEALKNRDLTTPQQLLQLVSCATGQRSLAGAHISLKFDTTAPPEKRLLRFHTCFYSVDVPLAYFGSLAVNEAATYIHQCVEAALADGMQLG